MLIVGPRGAGKTMVRSVFWKKDGWYRGAFDLLFFFFVCGQLLKCVLRDLLQEKEVQKNLLQVHLNGSPGSNLTSFIVEVSGTHDAFPACRSPPDE